MIFNYGLRQLNKIQMNSIIKMSVANFSNKNNENNKTPN